MLNRLTNLLREQNNTSILLLAAGIILTRIPFLFSGYGSEEDAWGLILVARNIDLTGIYEVSRMPGHPVQEIFLSWLWELPAWFLNTLTAFVSTAGVVFFILTLRIWEIKNYLLAGGLLAFTPVFYINSSNTMDYTWALALVMAAMFQLANNRVLLAGILLGVACGFRVTAGAMVIPFAILLWPQMNSIRKIILLGSGTTFVAILCFIPAFQVYGIDFFTYYEYFPYPPILKNIYKATFGAWGIPGIIAIGVGFALCLYNLKKTSPEIKKNILLMCLAVLILYTYAFLRIPQKSAFVIPMIPFLAIIFAMLLTQRQMAWSVVLMIISCFLFGINLDDKLRGSKTSPLAVRFEIGNTPVAFDPLVGMVTADHFKRLQKIAYAKATVNKLQNEKSKTVIIAGWWQNELKYFSLNNGNSKVSYLYYADETQLQDSIANGNRIYYLPEQDYYNDLRFGKEFTKQLANSFN